MRATHGILHTLTPWLVTALVAGCTPVAMPDEPRPAPGAKAPDFTLPDQDGKATRLHALSAQGPVVLVFYRGHW